MPRPTRTSRGHEARALSSRSDRREQTLGSSDIGRLVLVVGADPAALAVMLDAARRRFPREPRLSFPVLATTRRGYFGGHEIVLNRREFNEATAAGGFLATWHTRDTLTALPISARADLVAGHNVIVPAPSEGICDGSGSDRMPWPNIGIVRVTAHTDLARLALTPRACLSRMLGPRNSAPASFPSAPSRPHAEVHLGKTLASGVSGISAALTHVLGTSRAA